jgi:hypothetical protein
MNEAFVLSKKEAKELNIEKKITFPYAYRGGEVEAYKLLEPDSVIIYPYTISESGELVLIPEKTLKQNFPNTYKHLLSKKEALRKRQDSRKYYADNETWYRHLRAGNEHVIKSDKLAVKGISLRCTVGILKGPSAFDGARCPCIIIENKQNHSDSFFLGLLNSKLATYHLKSVCSQKLHNYIEFSAKALTNFPVRVINFKNEEDKLLHDDISRNVDVILELYTSENIDKRRLVHTESNIDKLIYKLYGLSSDEIEIIENGVHSGNA